VSCIVPLAFGLYWKRANAAGAVMSVVLGLGTWIAMELFAAEGIWPPQLVGVLFSVFGMLVGSLATRPVAAHHS